MKNYWIRYNFGKEEHSVSREIEADSYASAMQEALTDYGNSRYVSVFGNEASFLVNLDKVLYVEITEA